MAYSYFSVCYLTLGVLTINSSQLFGSLSRNFEAKTRGAIKIRKAKEKKDLETLQKEDVACKKKS